MNTIKNKIKFASLGIVASIALHAGTAFAGAEGHGGTVLDCNGQVRLADFVEPVVLPGLAQLEIPQSDAEVGVQIEAAIQKIGKYGDEKLKSDLREAIARIQAKAKSTTNYSWTLTSDVGAFPLPNGCAKEDLKNVVIYLTRTIIQRNEVLYKALPNNTHKAGLWFHEGVFELIRDRAQEFSAVPARRITAFAFSNYDHAELGKQIVQTYLTKKGRRPAPMPSEGFLELDIGNASVLDGRYYRAHGMWSFAYAGTDSLFNGGAQSEYLFTVKMSEIKAPQLIFATKRYVKGESIAEVEEKIAAAPVLAILGKTFTAVPERKPNIDCNNGCWASVIYNLKIKLVSAAGPGESGSILENFIAGELPN